MRDVSISIEKYESLAAFAYKISINEADSCELEIIPGIGAALAWNIINYRDANGSLSSFDDLKNIKGIGPAKAAVIQRWSQL